MPAIGASLVATTCRRVPLSLRIGGRGWGRGLASEGAGWHSEGHGWDRGRLLGRRVVYFGERHEEPAVCAAQLAALQEWLEANPATPTALVLEHFTAQQQHILDRWGQDDPRELVDEYEAQNGEFDIGLYGTSLYLQLLQKQRCSLLRAFQVELKPERQSGDPWM